MDSQAESFAMTVQTAVRETTNNLSETLSNRRAKFCGDYLNLISEKDAAIRYEITGLRTLLGISVEAVTRVAGTSARLPVSNLSRFAEDSGTSPSVSQGGSPASKADVLVRSARMGGITILGDQSSTDSDSNPRPLG